MKVQVVLRLGSFSNEKLVVKGDHYVNCMTGNSYFTAVEIVTQLAKCKTSADNLRDAINLPTSDSKTDKIKTARDSLDRNINVLGGMVEDVANDPAIPDTQRVEIVHSAGMEVKEQTHPGKHIFSATNTKISGRAHLTAEGGANSHEWQYTTDTTNFTGRIAATTSTTSSIDIDGLKKGTEYAFFHKAIKAGQDTDWEGPIFLMVI
jgi:hypothetical protein